MTAEALRAKTFADLKLLGFHPANSLPLPDLGTANAEGQLFDKRTLGFADFGGNQQYVTLGNLSENPRAFLFLMDYANSRRIKVWGTARVIEGDAALLEKLRDPEYSGEAERAILFAIEAWDVNCPQHIHRRFSERQVAPVIEELKARIAELEAEVTRLQLRRNKPQGA